MEALYFLQHYWWALVSLLGAILVFLLFVQGAQGLLFNVASSKEEKDHVVKYAGHKWEMTFTTLVTFGGAAFASFPLFYSTSFGGAYWLWFAILFCFVIQAVSFEFRDDAGFFIHCCCPPFIIALFACVVGEIALNEYYGRTLVA